MVALFSKLPQKKSKYDVEINVGLYAAHLCLQKKRFASRMIFELTQIDFDMVGFSRVL